MLTFLVHPKELLKLARGVVSVRLLRSSRVFLSRGSFGGVDAVI